MIPEDLRYTAKHEWLAPAADAGTFRVGITDFAQDELGGIVFVKLPEVGTTVQADDAFGEVESTKSVSDIFAPVSGEIVAVNSALDSEAEVINSDPYGAGWIIELKADDPAAVEALLDAAAYRELTENS